MSVFAVVEWGIGLEIVQSLDGEVAVEAEEEEEAVVVEEEAAVVAGDPHHLEGGDHDLGTGREVAADPENVETAEDAADPVTDAGAEAILMIERETGQAVGQEMVIVNLVVNQGIKAGLEVEKIVPLAANKGLVLNLAPSLLVIPSRPVVQNHLAGRDLGQNQGQNLKVVPEVHKKNKRKRINQPMVTQKIKLLMTVKTKKEKMTGLEVKARIKHAYYNTRSI